ncbi:hypothetical protein Daus18300_007583 [Diaporthe australafricana]|uniref:Uncharacterized protein n=1 Tax=Diaporthe australafricana TaxID=127596 RepID=A0ABR3WLV5_9PEZI
MASALSPEVQLMRRRVRHVHIPDLPPLYAPRKLAYNIRDHIEGQITRQRALAAAYQPPSDANHGFAKVPSAFASWLKRAGPPPTVLSFTRRPIYILPKHQVAKQEPWQVEYLTNALKSRMDLRFPEPPGWSSVPWRPSREVNLKEIEWQHNPLEHQWTDVGVLIMPCAESMFLGPGQLSIWPIIDLQDEIQKGRGRLGTKYEYERILEDTTIELLKREFNIQAFSIPGSTGVWVESRIPPQEVDLEPAEAQNVKGRIESPESLVVSKRRANARRIATVHASTTNKITQWGVSLHVGQPDPTVDSWTSSTNPWTPIRQHNTTTSIAAELSFMKSTASPLGRSKYLLTHFDQNSAPARAGQGAIPYSLIKAASGKRSPAPLGMDNRDISTAWTYEFARQLGMKDGHVDHYSMVDHDDLDAINLPKKSSGLGFGFHGVYSEDVMKRTYKQVEVPHIMPEKQREIFPDVLKDSLRLEQHDGNVDPNHPDRPLLSWPLWEDMLTRKLDEAICGGPSDTRLKAYEKQKQMSSSLQRRRNEIQQANKIGEEWRARMPALIRRPLKDSVIQELAERSREMESLLKTVRIGKKSAKLLDSTIQIRRLLERHFAGALNRDAELSAVAAASDAASTDPFDISNSAEGAERSLNAVQKSPTRFRQRTTTERTFPTSEAEDDDAKLLRSLEGQIIGGPQNLAELIEKGAERSLNAVQKAKDDDAKLLRSLEGQIIGGPRNWVEFTETNTSKHRARAEQRMRKLQERPAARVQKRPRISQFLPNTQQI